MTVKSKRFIVLVIAILAAAALGFESTILFGPGLISSLISILGGAIIGIVGATLAGKIRD